MDRHRSIQSKAHDSVQENINNYMGFLLAPAEVFGLCPRFFGLWPIFFWPSDNPFLVQQLPKGPSGQFSDVGANVQVATMGKACMQALFRAAI